MEVQRKYILDRFQEHLSTHFSSWCQLHNMEQSEPQLITFLIDQGLIPAIPLQRYTMIKEYELLFRQTGENKSTLVQLLANRFSISERTVWTVLKVNNK